MEEYSLKNLQGKLLLLSTILVSGMAFLDGSVVNIAVPVIQEKLNATISEIQWIINAYSLMLSSLILISGSLSDKFGRKKLFLYGIFVFILFSFLNGLSNSSLELIVFRAFQGIGAAMMVPGSLTILNVSFKQSEKGRVIGLWSGFAAGIASLGPFVGGFFTQKFGWQSIFFINIPLGLVAIFLVIKFVRESSDKTSGNIDLIGSIIIFLSLLGISYGLIQSTVAVLLVGIILFIIFIFLQTKIKNPLIPLNIFKSSLVTGANLATLFLYSALSGVGFFLVLNLQQIQHYPPLTAGLGILPLILIITFFSGVGGTIADKIGPRIPMIIGPLLVSIGMLSFIFSSVNANYYINFLPGLLLFGLGMAMVIAPLTKSALSVPHEYSGAASGVNNAIARVAGLLAIALSGAIALSIFSFSLTTSINKISISNSQSQQILKQVDKYGAISVPQAFDQTLRKQTENAIDNSLVYSFRWVIGINALLAFLSAVISFFTIHNTGKLDN